MLISSYFALYQGVETRVVEKSLIYLISSGTEYVSIDALVKIWQQGAYAKTR